MTREEAWRRAKGYLYDVLSGEEADEIIKALEQEPCEDAISRQAVLDLIADYDLSMGQVVKGIHALPPVNPQLKTGHWIPRNSFLLQYKCSECGLESEKSNFCSNCGAKMIEP